MACTPFQQSKQNQVGEFLYTTQIKGLWYLADKTFQDGRGFYREISRLPELTALLGTEFSVKQLNHSSSRQHVTRGIHGEKWNKLLTIISGSAFCAWVDLRPNSSTFKSCVTAQVGEDGLTGSFLVSTGIGNSFCVTEGPLQYLYAVDQLYAQRDTTGDVAVSLFDPELSIPWPIERDEMILSQRDEQAVSVAEWLRQRS